MKVCPDCPYRGRCEAKQRCIQGNNPLPLPEPVPDFPQNVLTSSGDKPTKRVEAPSIFKKKVKKNEIN